MGKKRGQFLQIIADVNHCQIFFEKESLSFF